MEDIKVGEKIRCNDGRLKDVERENNELKETIINLTKIFLNRDKELIKTIQDINKNLRILARRK